MIVTRLDTTKDWRDQDCGGKRENTVHVVRYGGFGDAIQVSSVFPLLKKRGKRVSVGVTEYSYDILRNDPNIDELLFQKTDQVPNQELGPYWEKLEGLFDEVINLSGVVEDKLLCLPRNKDLYFAPTEVRHKKLNRNYHEALHDVAGLEYEFESHFFPTSSEKKWVKRERKRMKLNSDHFVIVIGLSGTSVHKAYPHMDAVIAQLLLKHPEVRIVMTGDGLCQLLELGWEEEPRIFLRSGVWSIRKAITFAQSADLVLGPETGLLNAVGMEDMAKVCMLSHSSDENLTKHWRNVTAITPKGLDCYPCHKMHYGFKHCNRDETTGAAMCAAQIDPSDVVKAIEAYRHEFRKTA